MFKNISQKMVHAGNYGLLENMYDILWYPEGTKRRLLGLKGDNIVEKDFFCDSHLSWTFQSI